MITSALVTTGCMKANTVAVEQSSQQAAEAIGCTNFKSLVYDSMYSYLDNENLAPNLEEFSKSLNTNIDLIAKKQNINNPEEIALLKSEISSLYKTLIEEASKLKQTTTSREHLQTLIEMEMGDTSSEENKKLNSLVAMQFAKVQATSKSLNVQCTNSTPTSPNLSEADQIVQENTISASKTGVFIGSQNVLATAYQSCQALQIPEIDASTADVQGIVRNGTHADGIGGKRAVASVTKVQQTHPYIKVASGKQNGCFDVRNNPLIYDYGGGPSVSNNTLNFFKDSGSGTSVLGVDCSAYVSSAIAAGGLRYKPGVENKAVFIRQSSKKFINAKSSGFTCFSNVTATPTKGMAAGDIVAVSGHVVIVDKVGADPFGIKRLKSINDCSSLDSKYFDFVVSQSSPSKNGIGLNRYVAKDYLKESSKMMEAFKGIGKAVCQAYFSNKNVATPSSAYGIIRHTGAKDCLSPKIAMVNQSCVNQCLQ